MYITLWVSRTDVTTKPAGWGACVRVEREKKGASCLAIYKVHYIETVDKHCVIGYCSGLNIEHCSCVTYCASKKKRVPVGPHGSVSQRT